MDVGCRMLNDYIRQLRRFVALFLVRPAALVCGALFSSLYTVLFAWWLDGLTSNGLRRHLERDIRAEQAWIFEKYNAKLVPETKRYRHVFDYAELTLAVDPLLLNFVRGRGETRVNVAPAHAPHDWYDFGEAIALACDEPRETPAKVHGMSDFRTLFETHIECLRTFFSEQKYGPAKPDRSVVKLVRL
jgi:hypothetical protein